MNDEDSSKSDRLPSPALAVIAAAAGGGNNSSENVPFNSSNTIMSKPLSTASIISSTITNSNGNLDLENNNSGNVQDVEIGEDQLDTVLLDLDVGDGDGDEESNSTAKNGSIGSIELNSINSGNHANTNTNASNSIIREGLSHVNDPKYKLFRWSNIV
jgi:hypothetical protein